MATIKSIQKRIKSAKNISQITKAMQMVAAARMKKAQKDALEGKPYAQKIIDAVKELSMAVDVSSHPLLTKHTANNKSLVLLFSTNKGLCGGLNGGLFRHVNEWFKSINASYVTIGSKGELFILATKKELLADFSNETIESAISALSTFAIDAFISGKYENVYVAYNEFISSLKQTPIFKQLLPLSIENEVKNEENKELLTGEFLVEPSKQTVLDALLPHYLGTQIRSAYLESIASEHSARMIAMKNATDNAYNLISDLTLSYNRLRQEKITYEISDMVTARISME